MNKIFDSHAHYDDGRFESDVDELLKHIHNECDVEKVVNAAASYESLNKLQKMSEKYDFVYFTAGIHPEYADTILNKKGWLSDVESMACDKKCVAIGEIGLDYYYGKETVNQQKEVFVSQMQLAEKLSMPVVIHDREAHFDCMEIIKKFPCVKGVFHSYSGSCEMLKELLKIGYYFSINGIVTFNNARKIHEVLDFVRKTGKSALDRMLVETDSPYLTPVPFRGKRNDSSNIKYVAEKAATLLGMSYDEFLSLTYKNACDFYKIQE